MTTEMCAFIRDFRAENSPNPQIFVGYKTSGTNMKHPDHRRPYRLVILQSIRSVCKLVSTLATRIVKVFDVPFTTYLSAVTSLVRSPAGTR